MNNWFSAKKIARLFVQYLAIYKNKNLPKKSGMKLATLFNDISGVSFKGSL